MPANFIFGRGRIDGRPVVVAGDDFTVRGGAADAAIHQKMVAAEQMAGELRLPLVRLVDGTGGGGSVKTIGQDRRTYVPFIPGWDIVVDNLAAVPVVALALGSVAGLGAARVVSSHYSLMVKGTSQVFVAGPPVVARLGEKVDKEELGGSHIHGRNGVVDDVVDSEKEAFERTRPVPLLPAVVGRRDRRAGETSTDEPGRREDWLIGAIPRNRRTALRRPARSSTPSSTATASSRSGRRGAGRRSPGWPGSTAGRSRCSPATPCSTAPAGPPTRRTRSPASSTWPTRSTCPSSTSSTSPGSSIGAEAERAATIRHGARALAAIYQAEVPWCSVILRRVFGVAGAGHANHARFHYRYAWPSGDWGSLPLEGGVEAAFRAELDAAASPEERAELLERLTAELDRVRSPLRTAEAFLVEEIIDPRDTRPLLCEFANLAAPAAAARPAGHRLPAVNGRGTSGTPSQR